jgi:hypothetical protein
MLLRWPWGQHLEVSVLPHGKRQRPKGKLGAEKELYVECIRCRGFPGWQTFDATLSMLCREILRV